MQIILLQDVKSLGKKGDVKDVSEGYARNFLFPKKLASPATPGAINESNLKKEGEMARQKKETADLLELAKKIGNEKIILKTKAKAGKLFGSITKKQLVEEFKKSNLDVSEKCIIMKEVIKKVGAYEIEVRLAVGIKAKVKLEVSGA